MNINELIVSVLKGWIEANQPDNKSFMTSAGTLTAEQILEQLKEETNWGNDFMKIIKLRYLQYSQRRSVASEEARERIVYYFVDETMKNLQTLAHQ